MEIDAKIKDQIFEQIANSLNDAKPVSVFNLLSGPITQMIYAKRLLYEYQSLQASDKQGNKDLQKILYVSYKEKKTNKVHFTIKSEIELADMISNKKNVQIIDAFIYMIFDNSQMSAEDIMHNQDITLAENYDNLSQEDQIFFQQNDDLVHQNAVSAKVRSSGSGAKAAPFEPTKQIQKPMKQVIAPIQNKKTTSVAPAVKKQNPIQIGKKQPVVATSFFKQAESKKKDEQPQKRVEQPQDVKEDSEMCFDQNIMESNSKNSNVKKNVTMNDLEDDVEDLEISGPKRLIRKSKKRKLYTSDDESDENDQILQNQDEPTEETRMMKKKNFMESFCDKSKEQSSLSSQRSNIPPPPKKEETGGVSLKAKSGFRIVTKQVMKEINGYTEVVFEDVYEKMSAAEIKAEDERKKKLRIEQTQITMKQAQEKQKAKEKAEAAVGGADSKVLKKQTMLSFFKNKK